MKILIADNLNLVKKEVRRIIDTLPYGNMVEEVSDGNTALSKVCADQYDLAILGSAIPGISGFEVLKEMKEKAIQTRVLIFDEFPQGKSSLKAFKLGAAGYLSTYSANCVLNLAIQHIASGKE